MKQRLRYVSPQPGDETPGRERLRPLLPFIATFLTVGFFAVYYAQTYMCSCSCLGCPGGRASNERTLVAWVSPCCRSPLFTELFNRLQDPNAAPPYRQSPPSYVGPDCPTPTPESDPARAQASTPSRTPSPTPTPTPTPSPTPTPTPFNQGPVVMAVTYQGHVAWVLFAGLYLIACAGALGVGGWVVWDDAGGGTRRRVLTLVVALGAGVFGALPALLVLGTYKLDIFTQLINNTVNRDIYNISRLEFALDGVGLVQAAFLAAACCVTLRRREDARLGGRELVAVQYEHLTLVLYAGTALLILATLRVNALLHWSLNFLQPPPWLADDAGKEALFIYKGVEGLVTNLVTSVGAFGTLLLAAIYLPAALVLNARAAQTAPGGLQADVAAEPHPASKGLSFALPLPEQLLRLAVILGPFIAGPLGDWVSRLK